MHEHKKCKHDLSFCEHCDIVWCEKCGQEWKKLGLNSILDKYNQTNTPYRRSDLPFMDSNRITYMAQRIESVHQH